MDCYCSPSVGGNERARSGRAVRELAVELRETLRASKSIRACLRELHWFFIDSSFQWRLALAAAAVLTVSINFYAALTCEPFGNERVSRAVYSSSSYQRFSINLKNPLACSNRHRFHRASFYARLEISKRRSLENQDTRYLLIYLYIWSSIRRSLLRIICIRTFFLRRSYLELISPAALIFHDKRNSRRSLNRLY